MITADQTTSDQELPQADSHGTDTVLSYTVEKGDTLSHIAKQLYGKAGHWEIIFEANRDQIADPDLVQPGQVLRIPPAPDDSRGP